MQKVTENVKIPLSTLAKIRYIDMNGKSCRVIETVAPERILYWCIDTGEYLGDGL